jgi:transketolase
MKLSPKTIRQEILTMAYHGKSVHIPSAFSIVEILCSLYENYIKNPLASNKDDRFVLSKGHGTMALYAILVELKIIDKDCLKNYFKDGSLLHGLPEIHTPGIEATTGSLGHGLPIATGMALAMKLQKIKKNVFCLIGDGELNEGPNWESLLLANQQKLNNLIVIVDINKWQAMGKTQEILDLEDLKNKFDSFGFVTRRCDGHDLEALKSNLDFLLGETSTKPRALLADTVKGKGITFIENDNNWHYRKLDLSTYTQAMKEL